MRLGCVCPIKPRRPRPAKRQIFGSCVVFPEPVSPLTMITGLSRMAFSKTAHSRLTGRSGASVKSGIGVRSCGKFEKKRFSVSWQDAFSERRVFLGTKTAFFSAGIFSVCFWDLPISSRKFLSEDAEFIFKSLKAPRKNNCELYRQGQSVFSRLRDKPLKCSLRAGTSTL